MLTFHPLTLRFHDQGLERRYRETNLPRLRHQGQMAMVVGIFVYLLCGLLDQWFAPEQTRATVWQIRLTALCMPAVVLALSFTPLFERLSQLLLALVCLAAGLGIILVQMQLPLESASYYYPLMVLVTFYTYNFIGVRFVTALGVDLGLLATYNGVFGVAMDYPLHVILGHDTYIISANLIGGAAGYLAEKQKRVLFLRERELEQERHYHWHRSLHDRLTGLPNRELLYDRLQQAVDKSRRDGKRHCGFFVDLDGFKRVNDTLGHRMGDKVLLEVSTRLASTFRESDTVARIGGDEFFVLAHDVADDQSARKLARKVLERVNQPIAGVPEELCLSASIGLCCFPYPGMSVEDIIHRADSAMYRVKSGTKGDFSFASLPD